MKIGIIGAGRFAKTAIIPALRQIEDIEITAIYNRTYTKARQLASEYQIAKIFDDLYKFLAIPNTAILVLSSPLIHKEHVISAFQAGKHVFCEKPLSPKLKEIEEMNTYAERYQKKFMVGFNRRYAPHFQKIKDIFSNTQIGLCSVKKHKDNPDSRGLLNDAIHCLDLMRWFCQGAVQRISAVAEYDDPYSEKSLAAILKFSSGSIGTLALNRSSGQWLEISEFHGGGISAVVDYPKNLAVFSLAKKDVYDFKAKDWAWAINMPWLGGFVQELEHFFTCIKTDQDILTSGKDALLTHQLVDSIYQEAGLPGLTN